MALDIRVDDRIAVDPATDLFMQGVAYGRVTKVGRRWITFVSTGLRGQGRTFRLPMERVTVVPSAPWLS